MKLALRVTTSSIAGLITFGLILFGPAGTFRYWQAWLFIVVFTVVTIGPTIHLARTNPTVLERRMHAGPRAETRPAQKFIVTASFLAIFAMMAFSAFDHRMGWSGVPVWVCLLGDVLVAAGVGTTMLVVLQNNYAAATVTVEEGQKVASGGLYKFVRHPMYAGSLVMMVGIPLALGSYWGLLVIIAGIPMLVLRIVDEEKLLTEELAGYREYAQRVRYRLVPSVW
ncbi:isoprenylcysteine carboxylmethyltransferase family protein [Mycobacterium sp.]|uniref:methyltransferase family protein n=1 Tax=Mycobacterium sp. TaxID=1785 RepID=UPI0025E5DBA8|nr:isoprenylcysteine carboxylmethyltransferase family protein [Mycobacterium sp.]MBW0013308.1 isoprenylcysteine carboxylmethyltransferase family protein [Mycobacterium sp.]